MALTVNTTYAGEYAKEIISASLSGASTLENGLVEIKENINHKRVVKTLSFGTLLTGANCAYDGAGVATMDERILQIAQLKAELSVCKEEFVDDWLSIEQGASAHLDMPKSAGDYLLLEMGNQVGTELENLIWNADSSGSDEFDGFLTKFKEAGSGVVAVTETAPGASAASATVAVELQKVIDAIPSTILRKDDLFLYVANDVYQAYIAYLGGYGNAGLGANGYKGEGPNQAFSGLMFGGVKIVPVDGMPAGEVVAARKSNLWFGTNLLSDKNTAKVLDQAEVTGADKVHVVMKFGVGVQFGFGGEVVYYSA